MTEMAQQQTCLSPRAVKEAGISKYKFYKYVKGNHYEKTARGFYIPNDEWPDNLYILHQRCPQAVFSHDEALYYYGLIDKEPLIPTITIYSGYNAHRLKNDCKVYTVKKELLDIGKTVVVNNAGNKIPMYDLERTICDLFRSRSNFEIQDFSAAVKAYILRKDRNLNKLMEYSTLFHVNNLIRKYVEMLL